MKANEVMRQKIRLSTSILEHWKARFHKIHSSSAHGEPLRLSDLGSEFEHIESNRKFRIVGMTDVDTIICTETIDGNEVHWEMNKHFIQKCLGRKNEKFSRGFKNGFGFWEPFENTHNKMKLTAID